jgi:hypothetical protein
MRTAFTALMMEAVRTSGTSVYFHETTRRYIPESCHLHRLWSEFLFFLSLQNGISYTKQTKDMNHNFWKSTLRPIISPTLPI